MEPSQSSDGEQVTADCTDILPPPILRHESVSPTLSKSTSFSSKIIHEGISLDSDTQSFRHRSISPTLSKQESFSMSSKIIHEGISIDSDSVRPAQVSISYDFDKHGAEENGRPKVTRSKGSLRHLYKRSSESALNKRHSTESEKNLSHSSLNRFARENDAKLLVSIDRRGSLDSHEVSKNARDRLMKLGHSFPVPSGNVQYGTTANSDENTKLGRFSGIFRKRSGSAKSLSRKPAAICESRSDYEASRLKRHASFSGMKRSNSFSNDKEVVRERDKALEEWGKAAGRCEELIEELESTLTELMIMKANCDEKEQEIQNVMVFYEHHLDESERKIIELGEQLMLAEDKIDVARREKREAYDQRDELLQHSYQCTQEVESLTNAEQKRKEENRNLMEQIKIFENQVITLKSDRDHAVQLWKETSEERKKVYDEQILLTHAKDEALRKSFDQIEEINRLKMERDQLINEVQHMHRVTGTVVNDNDKKSDSGFISDIKLKQEELSSDKRPNNPGTFTSSASNFQMSKYDDDEDSGSEEYEDIAICMDTLDSRIGWKLANAYDEPRVMISLVTSQAEHKWNIKKHDRILSVNGTSVQRANKKTVERMIRDTTGRTISMVLRREKSCSAVRQQADIDVILAKQFNSLGLRFCLQVKHIMESSELIGVEYLKSGDIITKINTQDTSEIISSMIVKLIRKWNGRTTFRVKREGGFQEDQLNFNTQDNMQKRMSSLFNYTLRRKSSGASSGTSTPKSSIFTDISSLFSYSSASDKNLSSEGLLDSGKDTPEVSRFDRSSMVSANNKELKRQGGSNSPNKVLQRQGNRLSISTIHNSLDKLEEQSMTAHDTEDRPTSKFFKSLRIPGSRNLPRSWLPSSGNKSSADEADESDSNIDSPCLYRLSKYATLPRRYQRQGLYNTARRSMRVIRLEKEVNEPIGFGLCGGNKIGIFVKNLSPQSVAEGVKIGDRILSMNSVDLSKATLDFAMRVLLHNRNYSNIRIEVKHYLNFEQLSLKNPCESVYVRCLQPYSAQNSDELSFGVGEILHVTNTLVNFDETTMMWSWYGEKTKKKKGQILKGIIPWIEPFSETEYLVRPRSTNSLENLDTNYKRKRRKSFGRTAQDIRKWLTRKPSWGKRSCSKPERKVSRNEQLKKKVFYEILLEEQVTV